MHVEGPERLPVESDASPGGLLEPVEQAQEGGLARAAGADDRRRCGLVDVITDTVEDPMTVTFQDHTVEGERLSLQHPVSVSAG